MLVYDNRRRKYFMDKLLTEKQVAAWWGICIGWLRNARCTGQGPAFMKIGRAVRYPVSALQEWLKCSRKEA